MPLEMFKTKFQRAGEGHPGPFCTDENPQKDDAALLYKASFQKAGIVHASLVSPDDQNRPTIAGVPAANFVFHFIDGRLYQITISFNRENLAQVQEAMTSKYGRPSARTRLRYDNHLDASYDGIATTWNNLVSEIDLFETADAKNQTVLLVVHRDLRKLAEDRIRQTTKSRADDL